MADAWPPLAHARELVARHGGRVVVHADGACRGNPGPASYGTVVVLAGAAGAELAGEACRIGWATNNVAEYSGAIAGVRIARALGAKFITLQLDSQLVVRQLTGAYAVKSAGLAPLHAELLGSLSTVGWEAVHVAREHNARADRLANAALDGADIRPPA